MNPRDIKIRRSQKLLLCELINSPLCCSWGSFQSKFNGTTLMTTYINLVHVSIIYKVVSDKIQQNEELSVITLY